MMNAPTDQTTFNFDPENHTYTLHGKPLTGVTTVLSVVAKPALIQWAANETAKYIKENSPHLEVNGEVVSYEVSEETLKQAPYAHRKKKEQAGSDGTDVHSEVEQYIQSKIDGVKIPQRQWSKQARNFIDWAEDNKVEFLGSEMQVYSEKYWYAGTLDFLAIIGGKAFVGDVKTSSRIYPEMFWQTSAYQLALEELDYEMPIDGHVIVNIPKKGGIKVEYSYDYKHHKQAFLGALAIYREQNANSRKPV